MEGTNRAVTVFGGAGVFLTSIGTAGIASLPESYKVPSLLCTIIGGGMTALAFWLTKGKDAVGRSNEIVK